VKKLFLVLVLIMVLLCNCSWKPRDQGLFASYTAFNAIDIMQTREIFSNPDYYEVNPTLTKENHIPLMVGTNLLLYFIIDLLPDKYRTYFLVPAVLFKGGLIYHNYNMGIRF